MENIIREMIKHARDHHDSEMADFAYQLMNEMAITSNCPSNWRDIGENMKSEFSGDDWVEENCKLWDF